MPIYEYKCQACGKRMEKIQKLSDPPCKKCPSCGGALTKLISSPAIQFKGSGFYLTDYAKKNSPAEEKKRKAGEQPEKKAETGATASPAAKSEAPAEKKTEAKAADRKAESKPAGKKSSD
jgi:putative FmdB family regulatory protein